MLMKDHLGRDRFDGSVVELRDSNRQQGESMWEYKLIETLRTKFESLLNELGAQGWELVHFQYNPLTAEIVGVVKKRKEH